MLKDARIYTQNETLEPDTEHALPPLFNAQITQGNSTASGGSEEVNSSASFDAERLPIVVHSHLRWDFVWQRPQQIFSRLARHHRILFIEEPIWEEGEPHLNISEPYANIVRVIPVLKPPACDTDAQCQQILPLLRAAMNTHPMLAGQFATPIQWFYSPMTAPGMLGQLNAASVVYDCMDELANFRFAPADITQREQMLISQAKVVFTGGYQLYEAKSRYHDNVHFYGCGVDVEHFGQARQEETELPAEVAGLPRPIFGYYGVIDERLDYELISHLAQACPDASVVMVGPLAKVEQHMLPNQSNIHWLGQRSYADLPALVKSFDVCLMPFALNEATQYINPTKTLEYMAAGKPIVSTAVPDVVRNFVPVVTIAHSPSEFVQEVTRAHQGADTARITQGLEQANAATWDAIVKAMRNHLVQSVIKN